MEDKNVSKAKVQKYVDLYLYIKEQMAQPDWRNVTEHLHKNRAYRRFIEVYTDFVKDFESAERGYLKNQNVKSAEELSDAQIAHLSTALRKLEEKDSMSKVNLALGSTFGEGAGREKALVSVLVSEGKYHALEQEYKKAKGKAEAVREISGSMENARQDFARQLSTLTEAINASQNGSEAKVEGLDKKMQRVLTEQNNLRQAVLSEIGTFGERLEQIEQNQYSQMMQADALANAQANQPQTDLTPVLDQFYLAQQATDKTIGKATGKAIAETRRQGDETRETVRAQNEKTRNEVRAQGKATINAIRSEGRQTRVAIADLESRVNKKGSYIWAGAATTIALAATIGLLLTAHSCNSERDKRVILENQNSTYQTELVEAESGRVNAENRANIAESGRLDAENRANEAESGRLEAENKVAEVESERDAEKERADKYENKYTILGTDYLDLFDDYEKLQALYNELQSKPSDTASLEKYVDLCAKFNGNLAEVIKTGTFSEIEKLQVLSWVTDMSAMEESLGVKNHTWANELVGEVFNLGVDASKFANEITELNSKITNLEAIIEDYKKNPGGEISKVEYEQAVKAKEQAESERDALSASLAEYKASHTMSDEDVKADKEKTKKEYENTIAEKDKALEESKNTLATLNEKFEEYKKTNPTKAELDELTKRYNTEKAKLEDKIKTLEADKTTMQNSYDAYKVSTNKNIENLNKQVSDLTSEIEKLNDQIKNNSGVSQTEYDKMVAERDSLKSQLASAQKTASEVQAKLDTANKTITSTKNELTNMQKDFNNYKKNHNYTDAQYKTISDKLSEVQAKYDDAVKKLQESEDSSELNKAKEELEKYSNIVDEAYEAIGIAIESDASPEHLSKLLARLGVQLDLDNIIDNLQNNSQRGE